MLQDGDDGKLNEQNGKASACWWCVARSITHINSNETATASVMLQWLTNHITYPKLLNGAFQQRRQVTGYMVHRVDILPLEYILVST